MRSLARPPLLSLSALALAGALATPASAAAQTVSVQTIEATTRRIIAGAIVSLVDSTDRRVAQALTNESGRVQLRAPTRGRYRLRADRIGHPGTMTDPFLLADTSIVIVMPEERLNLPELTVAATSSCQEAESGTDVAQLWEEIRKGLTASRITTDAQAINLAVQRFRRYRSLGGALKMDSTLAEFTTRVSPFVSPDHKVLQNQGFVTASGESFQFLAPDARALLSDQFLENHCFNLVRPKREQAGMVGLGFKPVPERQVPEIEGTLWVDRASAELRHLEFGYLNLPHAVRTRGLGGRIEFERLATGAWIVRDWYIRMPNRIRSERQLPGRMRSSRDTVIGFIDEGGVVRAAGDLSIKVGETVARVQQRTTVEVEFRGRLVSLEGAPVAGALVAIAELDSMVTTGADGGFRLTGLSPGPLRLRGRAIGFAPFGATLTLGSERRLVDTSFTLRRVAQTLDSLVVTAPGYKAGKLEDFERRRKGGFGKFLTRAELHDPLKGGLDAQIRRMPRVMMVPIPWACRGGFAAAASTSGSGAALSGTVRDCMLGEIAAACYLSVYLDGSLYYSPAMQVVPPDLTKFSPLTLEAAEVYLGIAEIPAEYNATGSACGVILLWTRVG